MNGRKWARGLAAAAVMLAAMPAARADTAL